MPYEESKMTSHLKPFALSACVLAAALTGACATNRPSASPSNMAAAASQYEDIYLVRPASDPRNVVARATREFEAMGFQVHVVEQDRFLGKSEGTGFLVSSDGLLLTAAHVLEGQRSATVWLDGARYEADLVDSDAQADLAMLRLRSNAPLAIAPLALSSASPRLGSDVYAVDHASGTQGARLDKGLVSALTHVDGSATHLQVSMNRAGSGGAPLLLADGTVAGMVQKPTDGGVSRQNLALRGEQLATYLRTASGSRAGTETGRAESMEQAARAVAKVQGGIAPAGFQDKPRLVATVDYDSRFDKQHRFGDFTVALADLDSNRVLLTAGEGRHNLADSEETVIRRTFNEVRTTLGKTTQ